MSFDTVESGSLYPIVYDSESLKEISLTTVVSNLQGTSGRITVKVRSKYLRVNDVYMLDHYMSVKWR